MPEKLYVSAQSLLEDSFLLGSQIFDSGFRPNRIVAIWRGGVPVGIAVQELLDFAGVTTDHIPIRTVAYHDIDKQASSVKVHGLNYLVKNVSHDDRLLIVDDVFDTGSTIAQVINNLRADARANTPNDIRIAVPYYKPLRNRSDIRPDYYLHETEQWIKFPHSLEGLSDEEIRCHRPRLYEVLQEAKR